MKKEILDNCVNKKIKYINGAKFLKMRPKAFLPLKSRYQEFGEPVLAPQAPGPKKLYAVCNKTPDWIDDLVVKLTDENKYIG